jgi:hypothetical protein
MDLEERNLDILKVKNVDGLHIGWVIFSEEKRSAEEVTILNDLYEKLSPETKKALNLLYSDEFEKYKSKYCMSTKQLAERFFASVIKKKKGIFKKDILKNIFNEIKTLKEIDIKFLSSFLESMI